MDQRIMYHVSCIMYVYKYTDVDGLCNCVVVALN